MVGRFAEKPCCPTGLTVFSKNCMKFCNGYSRFVILLGPYAIKFPKSFGGMLSCLREKRIYELASPKQRKDLCRVIYGCGLFIVMERGKRIEAGNFPIITTYQRTVTGDLRYANFVVLASGKMALCDYGQREAAEYGKNVYEYLER